MKPIWMRRRHEVALFIFVMVTILFGTCLPLTNQMPMIQAGARASAMRAPDGVFGSTSFGNIS
jgi:hypothetical protein